VLAVKVGYERFCFWLELEVILFIDGMVWLSTGWQYILSDGDFLRFSLSF
jgi:hypothetical protein